MSMHTHTTSSTTIPAALFFDDIYGNIGGDDISDIEGLLRKEAATQLAAPRRQGGLKDLCEGKRRECFAINPFLIAIEEGWNVRNFALPENVAHIDTLARSMSQNGYIDLYPMTVIWKNGAPTIRDGECRLRAAWRAVRHYKARIDRAWVVTENRNADEITQRVNMDIGNNSKRFADIERAENIQRILHLNGDDKPDVASRLSISLPTVYALLALLDAPEPALKMINAGKVAPEVVRQAMREANGDPDLVVARIEGAVKVAEANGQHRATLKHDKAAQAGTTTLTRQAKVDRGEIHDILHSARINEDSEVDEATITVSLSELARLREVFNF